MDRLSGMGPEHAQKQPLFVFTLCSCSLEILYGPIKQEALFFQLTLMGPAYYIVGPYYKICVAIVPLQGEEK